MDEDGPKIAHTFYRHLVQADLDTTKAAEALHLATEAMRKGDLSALLALGPQYQVYDPMTTVSIGGVFGIGQIAPGV